MSERTIFIGALERQDPADRLAYLTQACGKDAALRAQVETLLRQNEQLGNFLESPASELALLKLPANAPAGGPIAQELGDYRILREIGRGGMGIVYEAEQLSLGRHVAMKVLPALSLPAGSLVWASNPLAGALAFGPAFAALVAQSDVVSDPGGQFVLAAALVAQG